MKPETAPTLDNARKHLGLCAAKLRKRESPTRSLNDDERSMLIGFGTASDWIRWARALSDLTFSTRAESLSARGAGITESVRFNQMWTATNALFAKDGILQLTPPLKKSPPPKGKGSKAKKPQKPSEAEQFQRLYAFASVDPALEAKLVATLHQLLGMQCNAAGITGKILWDGAPTMWEVIDQKYSRPEDRNRGIGKTIAQSIEKRQLPTPTGPELIYGARNWAVHGMLLTSFFRGSRQKYISFIGCITQLLALVLEGAAVKCLTLL